MIPGIVLAAGQSSRFGPEHKLLKTVLGRSVIYHSVRSALQSRLTQVIVVFGYRGEDVFESLDNLKDNPKLLPIHNPNWKSGRASSLKLALDSLARETPGFLVYPGDMPLMEAALIDEVIRTFQTHRKLCFPVYNQKKGHPVAFPKAWFRKLRSLSGDESAYAFIHKEWDQAIKMNCKNDKTQLNLNTPQDFERLLRLRTDHGQL